MHCLALNTNLTSFVSTISIEYKNGFFELSEWNVPISKHDNLKEAQWIKSVLESEQGGLASNN